MATTRRMPGRRIRQRHRAAAGHFLRGLAYGTGLVTATLLNTWLQRML
ncbi:hypothetical protein AB0M23_21635 [Streptomyces sp. NPDC052077]